MTTHDFLDDDLRDRAALYVLDALEAAEARAWRLHIAGCTTCRAEVDSLARTARELCHVAPAEEPPAGLFERVLRKIRSDPPRVATSPETGTQVWKRWTSRTTAQDGLHTVPHDDGAFEPTAIAGIEVRQLSLDPDNERVTMLVRMAAGTTYPPHRHGGPEECFVLQGDLHVGDVHMHAGDYQRADLESRHGAQRTDGGCLLLITSSLHDELCP